jgi:HTH-type transcriptional regulator/antitoxin HigA
MAKALGKAFDVHPDLFANLQRAFDMSRARDPDPGVERRAVLQGSYPIREMIKRQWLEDTDAALLEVQMTKFFAVRHLNEIPHLAHAAKRTYYDDYPPAQIAWLFRVKHIAQTMAVPEYSRAKLTAALNKFRAYRVEPEEIRHVPRVLAGAGVRYVLVEALPNAKIDGVCFWLDERSPVIGMSLRHDRIDNFWFVLAHEIQHVMLEHGREHEVIDAELEGERAGTGPSVSEEERQANLAGADFCVPQNELDLLFARKGTFISERDMVGFARRLQIHPGIAVGQIQNRRGQFNWLRKYLVKIRQHVLPGAVADGWGQVAPVTL